MSEERATLSTGFEIEFYDSFGNLKSLDDLIGTTAADAVREFQRIENASRGAVDMTAPKAELASFGNVMTRTAAQTEKSAERMVRQIERQIEVFGKTSTEVRELRAETLALNAAQNNMPELAGRLRTAAGELSRMERGTAVLGGTTKLAAHHTQNLAFQFQDLGVQMFAAAGSSAPLKMALTALVQQGTQINGIMSQAGIGIKGVATAFLSMARSVAVAALTNPYVLALAAAATVAYGAFKVLQSSIAETNKLDEYAKSAGLTKEELEKLGSTGLTVGDVFTGLWRTFDQITGIGEKFAGFKDAVVSAFNTAVKASGDAIALIYGAHVGVYDAIVATWRMLPAAMGDLFVQAVNASIRAMNELIKQATAGINFMIDATNTALEALGSSTRISRFGQTAIKEMGNSWAGSAGKAGDAAGAALRSGMARGVAGAKALGNQIYDNIAGANRDRVKGNIQKILDDRTDKKSPAAKISDEQKAYEAAVKAANDYIAAQEKATGAIGKSAKELRLMEDALQRANAPLAEQKTRLDEVAAAREKAYSAKAATDFEANVLQPLRNELALHGLVGTARAAATLELEKQAFIAKNMDDGLTVAMQRWQDYYRLKSELISKDTAAEREALNIKRMADELNRMIDAIERAGDGLARAFGPVGASIADITSAIVRQGVKQKEINDQLAKGDIKRGEAARRSGQLQIETYGDIAGSAKTFFKEGSAGYEAMAAAEKAFRIVQFAMSVQAMAQNMAETLGIVSNAAVKATAEGTAGIAAQSKLPFPLNIVAMGATAAALIAAGVAIVGAIGGGGGGSTATPANTGTGTVLGDSSAQSESIKRSIDALKDVDTLMLANSRQMATSLKSIDSQIGSLASLLVRSSDSINASSGVQTGSSGGILGSLFGSRTDITGSGLYGGSQSLGNVLNSGFDASYYSDVQKTKKFLGIVTGRSTTTTYAAADSTLENQFTLILRQFNDAILAASGPLGAATQDIQNKLNGFVVNIGKVDLQGLTGDEIEEKLSAVFGAAADSMASAAFPAIAQFQKVGEGAFETLVRVSSTVEQVTSSLNQLGQSALGMSVAAKLGLADQFDSISDMTSAVDSYFQAYYSQEEQTGARLQQLASVFGSLNLVMPETLVGYRRLVEAQDLNTASGQAAYATLLQLAPAFAELQEALSGAKSAADIASERQDLEKQLLELRGDTATLRALELSKLDASNRALQQEVWAISDAQEAAKAADELRQAWQSVGDTIRDEVARIRGLAGGNDSSSFAVLLGKFNAANDAARGGDKDAAGSLVGLSQSMLSAAAQVATSRQELARVQAQTAATLEATNSAIARLGNPSSTSDAGLLAASATTQESNNGTNAGTESELRTAIDDLRAEMAQMRVDNNAGHAATAGNTGSIKRTLENVTAASGGDAIATVAAA